MRFQEQLTQAIHEIDMRTNPFVRSIQTGVYSRAALQLYAVELVQHARNVLRIASAILACCDHVAVRHHLLANLLEEEGVVGFHPDHGLQVEFHRRHTELARRFAEANGVTVDESQPARIPSQWMNGELIHNRWLGPLAYATVGQEGQAPATFTALLEGFRQHYGFTAAELIFFSEHVTADECHSERGVEMVVAAATTPAAQAEALAGVRRGVSEMWHYYRKLDRKLRQVAGE